MVRSLIVRGTVALVLLGSGVALAKDAAKEKAELQADFKKLVDKVEDAKKKNEFAGKCASFADDFISLGKSRNAPEGLLNGGSLYEQCGDGKKAEQIYRDAIAMDAKFAPAHAALGSLILKKGDVDGAQGEFNTALKLEPTKSAQGWNGTALIMYEKYLKTGDKGLLLTPNTGAIARLRRGLAIDSDSMQAYSLLALIYFQLAESDRAKLDLAALVCKNAKEVNDKYAPIYNTLGLINLKRKNLTGALKEFRTAAELDPRYVEAQLNIGAITLSARDYAAAEKSFKAVIDVNPSNAQQLFDATLGMGVAVRGQGRFDEAEQWYSKAKAVDPKSCAVAYNLGVLYQDYKRTDDNSNLNKAKQILSDFIACGRASADKIDDAKRRIKDIDDTFKALAEAKKMEEEAKKMAEEQQAIIRKANDDLCKMLKQQTEEAAAKKQPVPTLQDATGKPLRCKADWTWDDSPAPEAPAPAAAAPPPAPPAKAAVAPAPAPAPAKPAPAAPAPAKPAAATPAPAPKK